MISSSGHTNRKLATAAGGTVQRGRDRVPDPPRRHGEAEDGDDEQPRPPDHRNGGHQRTGEAAHDEQGEAGGRIAHDLGPVHPDREVVPEHHRPKNRQDPLVVSAMVPSSTRGIATRVCHRPPSASTITPGERERPQHSPVIAAQLTLGPPAPSARVSGALRGGREEGAGPRRQGPPRAHPGVPPRAGAVRSPAAAPAPRPPPGPER